MTTGMVKRPVYLESGLLVDDAGTTLDVGGSFATDEEAIAGLITTKPVTPAALAAALAEQLGDTPADFPLAQGTWATRPVDANFTFVPGITYWRRMTDIGTQGGVMMLRSPSMTEFGFPALTKVVALLGTEAAPALTFAIGADGNGYKAVATFPADFFKEVTMMQIFGNVTPRTQSCKPLTTLGTAGTILDDTIKLQGTAISADSDWRIFDTVYFVNSSTFVTNAANPNIGTADTLSDRTGNVDTAAAMTLGIGATTGTEAATVDIHQLVVWVG